MRLFHAGPPAGTAAVKVPSLAIEAAAGDPATLVSEQVMRSRQT